MSKKSTNSNENLVNKACTSDDKKQNVEEIIAKAVAILREKFYFSRNASSEQFVSVEHKSGLNTIPVKSPQF